MTIKWNDGIEGEARSARQAREEAIKRVRSVKRARLWLWFATGIIAVAAYASWVDVFTGQADWWLPWANAVVSVLVLTVLLPVTFRSVRRTRQSSEELLAHRQERWEDVNRRLARGER